MHNDVTRKISAIMFADIMGYTALMQKDESLALSYRDKLKSKLESEISQHGGRIIKFSGDGALCSFDSALECVHVAIHTQQYLQQEPKVPVRMGIHQGDVVFEDNDVHGDGVNIASRLESFGVAGSIFISAKVYDDIKNQKDVQTVSLGKYLFKNVDEPIEIYAISNAGLVVPDQKKLEGKGEKYVEHIPVKKRIVNIGKILLPVFIIAIVAVIFLPPWLKKQNARSKIIPEIQQLVNENFRPPTRAYDLALEASKYIADDSVLIGLMEKVSVTLSIETDPAGAEVFWKDYDKPESEWRSAGITPLKDIRMPRGYLRMEIRKDGYQTVVYAGPSPYALLGKDIAQVTLHKNGVLPENMVYVPTKTSYMNLVGIEKHADKYIAPFLMDRYEVTNMQFKEFMDAGGYTNTTYWKFPVVQNGKEISHENALQFFIDRTGRPGPATWEAGTFPDGKANHPVTGISWYEAAAFAEWKQKMLPTVFHWAQVAETSRSEYILPFSNFSGKSTMDVGSLEGISTFGVYDIAGNAREWCLNDNGIPDAHFILGGGFNDPQYSFNDAYAQPALDRSAGNGFRCMLPFPDDTSLLALTGTVQIDFRDFKTEKPVDDNTFELIRRQYAYDNTPLNVHLDTTIYRDDWYVEKISIDAAYNNERLQLYLYLPKNGKPPYQTILFYPGSGDIYSRKFDPDKITGRIDFILKSGRAIVWPVYKGTHERWDELNSDLPSETVFYKDHLVMWRKDVGRTFDYLETRTDIQSDKFGFLGWSWGGYMGTILPALEDRIQVVVLNVGGMVMQHALPEADQINFLPRVTQPVLMLNGQYDMFFPVETSQKPMFALLGTPADKKKMIVYSSGHLVPKTDFVKESLFWFDTYLGEVK